MSAGTYTWTGQGTDAAGVSITQVFTLTIAPAPPPALVSTSPSTLPGGQVGAGYSFALTTSGGTPPVQWVLISGSLPPGLSLSSSGVLTGTPTP